MVTVLKPKQQELLVFALNNNGFSYKTQNIFRSKKFYDSIRFLKQFGYLIPVCAVCEVNLKDNELYICDKKNSKHNRFKTRERIFHLTIRGQILAMELRRYLSKN